MTTGQEVKIFQVPFKVTAVRQSYNAASSSWVRLTRESIDLGISLKFQTINKSGSNKVIVLQMCANGQDTQINAIELSSGAVLTESSSALGIQVKYTDAALSKLYVSCCYCSAKVFDSSFPPHRISLPFFMTWEVQSQNNNCSRNCRQGTSFQIELTPQIKPRPHTLQKMHDEGLLVDVTLKVGQEELQAHRSVLSACSSVFQRMFSKSTGFSESLTGIVNIKDFSKEVIEAGLRFIYGKDMDAIGTDTYIQLLIFADKYQIPDLKDLCQNMLSASDNKMDVFEMLALADSTNAEVLKEAVMRRIVTHPDRKSILKKSSVLEVVRSHPEAVTELLLRM